LVQLLAVAVAAGHKIQARRMVKVLVVVQGAVEEVL
jgi:hypothetical protein